jgi:hypothetical protein
MVPAVVWRRTVGRREKAASVCEELAERDRFKKDIEALDAGA